MEIVMTENEKKRSGPASSGVQEILQQRERLDQVLHEKFKKEATILFTDICGYTEYVDKRGDINGRALLLKHNHIVLPLIEKHGGKIIEIIGDAVMAAFSIPLDAVGASISIQKALEAHNLKTDPADSICVKIGINCGEVLVDDGVVYQGFSGNVANVASRIQSQAGSEEIFVSEAVYEKVRRCENIFCRFHKSLAIKGKNDPIKIYRVVWRDEDFIFTAKPKLRIYESAVEKKATKRLKVLHLDMSREGDRLKISAQDQITGEESTLRHYEEVSVSMSWIETRCREMVASLNKANRRGRVTREVLIKLREIGQVLHDELFPQSIKTKLKKTKAEYLNLSIDDQLVHIPWELLDDGQQFLCERFSMGRLVKTRQPLLGVKSRLIAAPLKMLVLADPEGNLKEAYTEGINIRDYMDQAKGLMAVSLHSGNISADSVKKKMRNFDFVHFAGHADYDAQNPAKSGWRLTQDRLTAQDVTKMAGTGTMPAFIFSNACQSALTKEWTIREQFQNEIFGLANAFLLAGVRHYVGTFWEIWDKPSARFALEFYKNLLSDMAVGEALRLARLSLIQEYGEETIFWTSYILYGDPTFNYMGQIEIIGKPSDSEQVHTTIPASEVRAHEEINLGDQEVPKRRTPWWAMVSGIILALAIGMWGYSSFSKKQIAKYQKEALIYYHEGNFEQAIEVCKILEAKRPDSRLGALIAGNIYFKKGKLDRSETAYKKALQATDGTDLQKAEALAGLGRIASLRKKYNESLKYYRQAAEVSPNKEQGYLYQALLLEDTGDYGEAIDLFEKAKKLVPEDRTIAAHIKDIRKRSAVIQSQEKQERIDRLIKELLERMNSPVRALPSDSWTSLPLTMWVMDFEVQGYSLEEGKERLLFSGIVDQLLQHRRIQLVERSLLDKLLEELKLGTSNLTDRGTALSVGKILAARLILSGRLVYSESQIQVSIRLIETETGRITASVNESFGSAVATTVMADSLSKKILENIVKLYPYRGRISKVKGKEAILNIGQRVGVRKGQRFKAIDKGVTLEIISTLPDSSLAKIAEGKGDLKEGLRVEAVSDSDIIKSDS
jgi:class 3 adenylate cyclase/CHAT domain-containing protein/Tfp pilus assembly protein PilF/TolB-like protein